MLALKSLADIFFKASFCASVIDAASMSRASVAVIVDGFGVGTVVATAKVNGEGSAAALLSKPFKIASAT